MSDGPLLIQEGTAWRDLHGYVYRNLRSQGLSHADAEDLAQDILEQAYQHLPFIATERHQAWVQSVIRNKLIDRSRKSGRVHSVAEVPEAADPALGPDELVLRSVDRGLLLAALAELPPRDRQLLEVRYLRECTVAETADACGLSVGTTKVALYRARERLRTLLEEAESAVVPESRRATAPSEGLAARTVAVLTPYVGRVAADTCVRGTAVSIGKTFDTLTSADFEELARRVRAVLQPLLSPDTIERLITEIRGGGV